MENAARLRIHPLCGFIHYADSEPTFDGVILGAPSDRQLQEYMQEDFVSRQNG